VSKGAEQYVKALEASGGVWLPRAEWKALRVIARFYHEGVGCAFATVHRLADEAMVSDRHLRRAVAELDALGLVRRNGAERNGDGSHASNEYELPGYREVRAAEAVRGRVFTVARTRRAQQTRLPLGDAERLSPWMLFLQEMQRRNNRGADEGGCPGTAASHTNRDEGGCPAVVDCARFCPGPPDALSGEGRTQRPPIDFTKDADVDLSPPYAPPRNGGGVQKQPQRQKQRQRLPGQGGGLGKVVAFPQRQRAQREPREAMAAREQLDGEDAALWDETTRVMRACGVSPESSGRKVRRAILQALRLQGERTGEAIGAVGALAVERWREYERMAPMLFEPLGVTRFFSEGEWLRPGMWRLDRDMVQKSKRGGL
jgi:hypothetical protein